MKKYTSFFFAFIFVFSLLGLFNLNVNSANAITSDCMPGDNFSRTTGQRCITNTTPSECRPGDLFSSVTGKPCVGTAPVPRYCTLQAFPIGAKGEDVRKFQTELNAQGAGLKVDGSYGPRTQISAEIYCKRYPFPNPSSVVISGVNGPQSLEVNQQGTWTVTASDSNGGNLSYSVVWGDEVYAYPATVNPSRSLAVQQSATFTHSYSQAGTYTPTFTVESPNTIRCIQAPCPGNGGSAQTSLSVNVGNIVTPNPSSITVLSPNGGEIWQTGSKQIVSLRGQPFPSGSVVAFFLEDGSSNGTLGTMPWKSNQIYEVTMPNEHIVQSDMVIRFMPGKYKLKAVVYDKMPCLGLCPPTANPAKHLAQDLSDNYFTISGINTSSSITVLSPNGGELWIKGTTQTINWSRYTNFACPGGCDSPGYDINLQPYYPLCTSNVCPMYPFRSPYTIAKAVKGYSYEWPMKVCGYGGECSSDSIIQEGLYKIQVCQSGTDVCDSSDGYFTLTTVSYPSN